MFRVVECVWTQHDRWLVLLAATIWLVGSLAFFLLLRRSLECSDQRRNQWGGCSRSGGRRWRLGYPFCGHARLRRRTADQF